MYILIILAYLVIGIIEMVPLYKKNRKKELTVYTIFFLTAFIISLLLSLGVKIPSPAKPIEDVINRILGR
ncbi:MAG: hypothetical protein MJA82_08940 [Clostridia bacterium]|nr:hypothetical protein [Clostridia bacterium]